MLLSAVVSVLSARSYADSISAPSLYVRHIVATPVAPDSCDSVRLTKKAFWRAAAETAGFNVGLWAFDRYALKGHYAYISFNTIKENFKHGFEWDNDHLNTNMFAHPYNGSLFYNAGRSNGYNFWQSELFAIGGSAMWEMFMECEYPSTNDIIATPVGRGNRGGALPHFRLGTRRPFHRWRAFRARVGGVRHIAHARIHAHSHRTGVGETSHHGAAFWRAAHRRVAVARLTVAGVPR